jgi:hypothetical protein
LPSLPSLAATPWTGLGPGLQAHNEQKVYGLDGSILATNTDRPSGWRLSKEFGVFDRQGPTIGQINVEGLKRARLVQQT